MKTRRPLPVASLHARTVTLEPVGRRAAGRAGRLAHVVRDVEEVRALAGPQAVAGVGREPFGLVAGDLHDRDR
jgi:hypothetical protein